MVTGASYVDSINLARRAASFEWTFAIFSANLAIQSYRLIAQLVQFLFDLFKLTYGVDLFWPLTTDDMRPYSHYFTAHNEILYKIIESFILTIVAFYGARSLLNFSLAGLSINCFVFFLHSILLILGFFLVRDHSIKYLSLEFLFWLASLVVVMCDVILGVMLIFYFGYSIHQD